MAPIKNARFRHASSREVWRRCHPKPIGSGDDYIGRTSAQRNQLTKSNRRPLYRNYGGLVRKSATRTSSKAGQTSSFVTINYGRTNEMVKVMDDFRKKNKLRRLFLTLYDAVKRNVNGKPSIRFDMKAWNILKRSGRLFKIPKTIGRVYGVEIEERFGFRLELMIMGIHHAIIKGIDYMTVPHSHDVLASSIVTTQGYHDYTTRADVILYRGEGGDFEVSDHNFNDQKLTLGNLALKNSITARNPVRVVRGVRPRGSSRTIFIYDGLYTVIKCSKKIMRPHYKACFEFELQRCSGQKHIDWNKYK